MSISPFQKYLLTFKIWAETENKKFCNLAQVTKQESVKFCIGDTVVKEVIHWVLILNKKMERKDLQRTRFLPENSSRFPICNKSHPRPPGIQKTISQSKRKNPNISFFKMHKHLWKGKMKWLERYAPKYLRGYFWFICVHVLLWTFLIFSKYYILKWM